MDESSPQGYWWKRWEYLAASPYRQQTPLAMLHPSETSGYHSPCWTAQRSSRLQNTAGGTLLVGVLELQNTFYVCRLSQLYKIQAANIFWQQKKKLHPKLHILMKEHFIQQLSFAWSDPRLGSDHTKLLAAEMSSLGHNTPCLIFVLQLIHRFSANKATAAGSQEWREQ